METALARKGQKVFCSHFTLVNYDTEVPLGRSGRVGFRDQNYSPYEHGTTKSGREILHGQWLASNRFQLTLSGHSHRVGLYQAAYVPPHQPFMAQAGNNAYLQLGASMNSANEPAHLRTVGYHPEDPQTNKVAWGNRTRVFVTASAGPIPKQNLQGEMSGQGMEYPSAGKIIFADNTPRISLVKPTTTPAKPRFCVACDYIDIMKGGFWEYFRATGKSGEFELKIHWEKIHPRLPETAKERLIKDVTFWLVSGIDITEVAMATKSRHGDDLRLTFDSDLQTQIEFYGQSLGAIFISLKFNEAHIKTLPGFKDYDYTSPWNIQVGIYDNWGREVNATEKKEPNILDKAISLTGITQASKDTAKWIILRHKENGEVPDHKWWAKEWQNEFKYRIS